MSIEQFLTAPWWAGVQGISSILATIAIGLAVADFLLLRDSAAPHGDTFTIKKSSVVKDGLLTVSVSFRLMGSVTMYEAEIRTWGIETPQKLPVIDSVLDARSEEVQFELHMTPAEWQRGSVGIVWVVPRRRPYAGGSRVHFGTARYSEWKAHRFLPRVGRWVERKSDRTPKRMIVS